jgi:hypothetical protein
MITDKVQPHHLERKALLYVRQSSAHQVLHNRESSALQYAMRDRLTALGWSEIEVIDDDLGRSAAGGLWRLEEASQRLRPSQRLRLFVRNARSPKVLSPDNLSRDQNGSSCS